MSRCLTLSSKSKKYKAEKTIELKIGAILPQV